MPDIAGEGEGGEKKPLGDAASETDTEMGNGGGGEKGMIGEKDVIGEKDAIGEDESIRVVPEPGGGRKPRDKDADETQTDDDDDDDDDDDGNDERDAEPGSDDVERVATRHTASSARPRAMVVVPRAKRRGLLPWLAMLPEVENPYDYPARIKWTITVVTALAASAAPMGSSVFYPGLSQIAEDFGASQTVVNLTVAFYMLAMAIAPLWWSSFSETAGRRTVYLLSFLLNVAFTLCSGFSVNIAMLIVFRILSGAAAASVQAVGAGTIADIFMPAQRGRGMSVFYLGPLLGPLVAPILGGVLVEAFGWRSTMWFLVCYGVLVWCLVLFALPETLDRRKQQQAQLPPAAPTAPGQPADSGGVVSRTLSRVSTATSAAQAHTRRTAVNLRRVLVDPLSVLAYLRFPAVAVTVYYAAVTFGSLYVLNVSVQARFAEPPYDFSAVLVGLMYIPNSLGYVLASLTGGPWIDRLMVRAAEKAGRYDERGRLVLLPEDRMRENAWIAATLYPGALIWYGWTAQAGVMWLAPAFANFFFGIGSMLVFSAATTMLTEFMPRRSSSGVALNNFVRNIFSCVGGVVAQPLTTAMGTGWLMTMLGLICWISGNACIWLLRRNSAKWRVEMDKALNK